MPRKVRYLPRPDPAEFDARPVLVFSNGVTQAVDMDPDELVAQLTAFAEDEHPFFVFRDVQYGNPIWLTRAALADLRFIGNTYNRNEVPGDPPPATPFRA